MLAGLGLPVGLAAHSAFAATPLQAALESAPQHVRVGIYIIDLDQLDVRTGEYTAEFYLSFQCPGATTCDVDDFRIVDGTYTLLDKDIVQRPDGAKVTYHLRGNLNENLDYSAFPFDAHTLSIHVESSDKSQDALVFEPDDALSGLAPDVRMAGWMVTPDYTISVAPNAYKVFLEPFSRFTFQFHIQRPDLYGWLKALLPATIILVSGLLSYLFHHDAAGNSISVVTAALAGSVLFNVNLTSVLPATGNLTTADLFMINNYAALVVTLAIMIAIYVSTERKHVDRAQKLLKVARLTVPPLWILAQALLLLRTFLL
jgi:hypothetical protein